jgi:hypothetical protein
MSGRPFFVNFASSVPASFCPAEDSAQPSEAAGSYEPGKGLDGPPASSDSAGIPSGKLQTLVG